MPAIRIGILTLSDRAASGQRPDRSGPAIADFVRTQNWLVVKQDILPDDISLIQNALIEWEASGEVDVILTTGGTGFALRDTTPEATRAIIQREAPGLAEAMRSESMKLKPHGMLSRGVAGIRGRTLIVNLPGSPQGAIESLQTIVPVLPHAIQLLSDDPQSESSH
jgi:molybdenum cofactor synthesis domain-containing protein